MFCYASLLCETGLVDEVHLSFLVVGHTHCNLDQEFSVHSKKITDSAWIGSPLAMQELYLNAHRESIAVTSGEHDENESGPRKTISVQLRYMFDWKGFFNPVVHKNIKYFQVPHRFRIKVVKGVAVCQYMLFTDESLEREQWLPHEPPASTGSMIDPTLKQGCIQLKELSAVNGLPDLQRYMGIRGDVTKFVSFSKSSMPSGVLSALDGLLHDLRELDKVQLAGQIVNMELQSEGLETLPYHHKDLIMRAKADIQRELANVGNAKAGYITWLDYKRDNSWDPFSRPRILPHLPVEGERNSDEASKKLYDSARTIASVAHAVLHRVKNDGIAVGDSMAASIQDTTEDYSILVLHPKEKEWYEERQTCEDVIAKSTEFTIFI